MAEIGRITEINGDKATISLTRKSACAGCHACSTGTDEKEMVMTALNECNGKVGDNVQVELVVEKLMFATFVVYGIPLITTVLGFIIGFYVSGGNEIVSFFLGMIFMIITYFGIKKWDSFFKNDNYIPIAKKIV